MKYIFQLSIILFITLISEFIQTILPIPIPASIIGLVILFLLLLFKILKVDKVKETGEFLIKIMPIMFLPASIGIMTQFSAFLNFYFGFIIIVVLTTIGNFYCTGKLASFLLKKETKNYKK